MIDTRDCRFGIVGYGSYVPFNRISVEELALTRGFDVEKIRSGLMVKKKSVPGSDEDTVTIAVEAAKNSLTDFGLDGGDLGAIYVGSESHPYAVKPTAAIVGAALGLPKDYMAADLEFACKGGTAAMQICYMAVKSRQMEYAMAIGSDVAQAKPGDILECATGAGGAAFVFGHKNVVAAVDATLSVTTDTNDFWRRNLQRYPEHTGRFTGKPAYFAHTIDAAKKMMSKTNLMPKDFRYVIFHQPNGRFPRVVAKKLGFSDEQILPGLLVEEIGNTYSANVMLGLAAVLDVAKPNEKILLVSYGSGSGSDAFVLTTTENILSRKDKLKNR